MEYRLLIDMSTSCLNIYNTTNVKHFFRETIFEHLCFIQISMSALQIRALVTRPLIVPTLTALIAVLVNKDLLEMEQFVKVFKT